MGCYRTYRGVVLARFPFLLQSLLKPAKHAAKVNDVSSDRFEFFAGKESERSAYVT